MLKYVIIGAVIVGIVSFILWNLWKMVLLKHKYFSRSAAQFRQIALFENASFKLKSIKADKCKLWVLAIAGTVFAVAVAVAYFLIARSTILDNHTHSYRDRVITEPICITEGVREYKCRYCDDSYREAIAVIDHKYAESDRQDATCTQEGRIVYTCQMCAAAKEEGIALIAHQFTQIVETEPSCAIEGVLARQCQSCALVEKESIPTNGVHHFTISSFTPASFWKIGYDHYCCRDCGYETYSLRTNAFNWVIVLAIVVLLAALMTAIIVRAKECFWRYTFENPLFWAALICIILSILLMVLHWGVVLPHQASNEPVFGKLSGAPVECRLVAQESVEPSYTQYGTVLYQCQDCGKEYTECLPLKELDITQIPVYTEPVLTECAETEKNGKPSISNELPLHTRMTGKLTSQQDMDAYRVTLSADGHLGFQFTHEADAYSNHWYVTFYDTDKITILKEGYIDKDTAQFGCSDLPAGTYYLKISAISGGNPLLNSFSDADYHLIYTPQCAEHTQIVQYASGAPVCQEPVQIITVCNCCGAIVSEQTVAAPEHRWGQWEIPETNDGASPSEKIRSCTLCGQTQTGRDKKTWWEKLWD